MRVKRTKIKLGVRVMAVLGMLLLPNFFVHAQEIDLKTNIGPKQRKIGEAIDLSLSLEYQAKQNKISLPILPSAVNGFEELDQQKNDTTITNGRVKILIQKKYAHFDSGQWNFPALEFKILPQNEAQAYSIYSDSVKIDIQNVGANQLEEDESIVEVEEPWFEKIKAWLYGLLGLVLFLLLALFAWKYWKRRKAKGGKKKKAELRPWEQAMQSIDELAVKELWLRDAAKEHHTELTAIVRQYIEEAFEIDCFEKTSQEIISACKKFLQKRKYKKRSEELQKLRTLFTMADLVKFAKSTPTPEDHVQAMEEARSFVESTKEIFIEEERLEKMQNG